MATKQALYSVLLLLLGAIGGLGIGILLQLEYSRTAEPVESFQVDIVAPEKVVAFQLLRENLKTLSANQRMFSVSESPAEFTIEPTRAYDVQLPSGTELFVRADSGKVLLLVDGKTAFCVETGTAAKTQFQINLKISTCDNREARITAFAKGEAKKN